MTLTYPYSMLLQSTAGKPTGQRLDSHEADLEHGDWLLTMLKTFGKAYTLMSTQDKSSTTSLWPGMAAPFHS